MAKEESITMGMLNLTGIPNICEIVEDINRSISGIRGVHAEQAAETLRVIGQAIISDPRLKKQERQGTIENIQILAHEASLLPGERHPEVVKGALNYIPMLLSASLSLLNYFNAHVEILSRFFDID